MTTASSHAAPNPASFRFVLIQFLLPAAWLVGTWIPFYFLIQYKSGGLGDAVLVLGGWAALVAVYWLPLGMILLRWRGHWLSRLAAGYLASVPLYFLTLALVYAAFGYHFGPRTSSMWGIYFSATPTFYLLVLVLYFLVRRGRRLALAVRWTAGAAFVLASAGTLVVSARVDEYRWPAQPLFRVEIVNAKVVDAENNRIVDGQTIQIENGRIVRIAAASNSPGWERIDARGGYLVPGLIDVHVHLQTPVRSVQGPFTFSYFQESIQGDYAPQRREYLENGVTTIRSLGEPAAQIFALRSRVARHELLGPRIFAAGRLVTSPNGHPVSTIWTPQITRQSAILAMTPADVKAGLEKNYSEGPPDAVKIVYGTIGRAKERLSQSLLNQSVAWANSRQLISVVHAETAAEVADAVDSGATGVEHVASIESLPDPLVSAMLAHKTFADPTFGEFVTARSLAGDKPDAINSQLQKKFEFMQRLDKAGVRLAVGTDAPLVAYGQGLQDELAQFAKAGFAPARILTFVTIHNAAYLGKPNELGRIAPGFLADLFLVRANPLEDIGNLRKPEWVMRDGQVVAGQASGGKRVTFVISRF